MHTALTRGRLAYSMLLACASLGCGGAEFTGGEAAGAAGGPALSTGGTHSGDPPATTAGGTSSAPGAAGSGGTGAATGGSSGGHDEPRIMLDLTDCGADAFGTDIRPTLYSTLDSAPAITEPAIGELGFVGNAENDYRGGRCGSGTNIDQPSDYIKYHYQDNEVRHFDPLIGTMDFWYQPSFTHTDGLEHHLFGTANFELVGGMRMSKTSSDEGNALLATFRGPQVGDLEIRVPASGYQLTAGEWTRITLVWYLAADLPQRYTRLFIDGALAGEALPAVAFQMASDPSGYFVLGVWALDDSRHAAGVFDELKVFSRGP